MLSVGLIAELDYLSLAQTVLCLAHAVRYEGSFHLLLLPAAFLLGLSIEQASIRFGGTHCHASSLYFNISDCSSLNSVLIYVIWVYTCGISTLRLTARSYHWTAPFLAGLVFFCFCGVYELQGPLMGWWTWPSADLVLKAQSKLRQYGPLAEDPRGIVTSAYVGMALKDRVFGVAIMAPFFHAAIGGAIFLGLQILSFQQPLVLVILAPPLAMLWIIPTQLLADIHPALSRMIVVPTVMLGSFLLPFVRGPPLRETPPLDLKLFVIPLFHHSFFLSNALFRHGRHILPVQLKAFICLLSAISIVLHAYAAGIITNIIQKFQPKKNTLATIANAKGKIRIS